MSDLTLPGARGERDQLAARTDVLDRVGALRTLPDDMHVTTPMVAEFYGVDVELIRYHVKANREELDSDGYRVVNRSEFESEFGSLSNLDPKVRQVALVKAFFAIRTREAETRPAINGADLEESGQVSNLDSRVSGDGRAAERKHRAAMTICGSASEGWNDEGHEDHARRSRATTGRSARSARVREEFHREDDGYCNRASARGNQAGRRGRVVAVRCGSCNGSDSGERESNHQRHAVVSSSIHGTYSRATFVIERPLTNTGTRRNLAVSAGSGAVTSSRSQHV